MTGVLIGAGTALGVMIYWIVAASFLYCRLSGHMDQFVFPWDQWVDIAPYWTATSWTRLDVSLSALGASAPLAAGGHILYLRVRARRTASLYGTSDFAAPKDMHGAGITTTRKPL